MNNFHSKIFGLIDMDGNGYVDDSDVYDLDEKVVLVAIEVTQFNLFFYFFLNIAFGNDCWFI